MTNYLDKSKGMLVGLAVGDALGAPVEFGYSSDFIRKIKKNLEHFFDSPRGGKGEWTDDTSMALCIADSLLEKGGYDSYDIMDRYVRWLKEGYRTPDNKPALDVGFQTRKAIEEYKSYPAISKNFQKTDSAGNGAIMRLAPIIIANTFPDKKYQTLKEAFKQGKLTAEPENKNGEYINQKDIDPTLKMAELSCRETHDSIAAITTTELFATALYCALHGLPKQNIVTYCSRWLNNKEYDEFYLGNSCDLINRALGKDGKNLRDLEGYIVDCFVISLWGLINFDSFKDGMMAVICLGGDTDTNAACYGQLAGAFYGYKDIPEDWKKEVYLSKELTEIAKKLLNMPKCPILRTRFEDDEHFSEE